MTEILIKAKTMYAAMIANIQKGDPKSDNMKGLTEVSSIISSLITTIESQKEEIEKWKTSKESWEKETLFANGEIRKRDNEIVLLTKRMKDYEKQAVENMVRYEESQDAVESLKAITELAVKGLKWYADTDNHDNGYTRFDEDGLIKGVETFVEEDYGQHARNTLYEIERLQNA